MVVRTILLLLAAVGPLAFPLSQMGYGTMKQLALWMVLPAAGALAVIGWWESKMPRGRTSWLLLRGALAGTVATIGLEAIRYPGFKLGFMPGNLPRLMGVLLLDRFAQGPSTVSDVVGFGFHFWTGACFGIILFLAAPLRAHVWAVPYGLAIGIGFLASPVVEAIGAGFFGRDLGWTFAATVLAAHAAYGAALGAGFLWIRHRFLTPARVETI